MTALSQEMTNTKGIIEQQIQDQKLKEDLINLQFQYPGLMKGDIRKFPYPKDRRISMNLKVESDLQRSAATGVHENNLKQSPLNIDSEYTSPNQQFEVTKKFNRSNAKSALQTHNVPPFPSIKTVEDHHEYVELLKPPLVRSKGKGNEQNMFNKIPDRTYIQNPTNINPNDPRSSYGFKKQFMQDALRGDYHRNEVHGPNSKTVPYYEEDEKIDFHDTRLIKKLQEIKKLDAALPDVSVSLESDGRKDPNTYINKVIHANKLNGNKGKCVYPGCDAPYYKLKSNKQQKCKCNPNNSKRTSPVSNSQETLKNPRSTESEESFLK
uniref:Uncharacterized protein n=1 Tax=Pectinophora gossypiella TaxID=13191 RepID=A0A1E1VXV9_PECGO